MADQVTANQGLGYQMCNVVGRAGGGKDSFDKANQVRSLKQRHGKDFLGE
jgi:hypothetical protein